MGLNLKNIVVSLDGEVRTNEYFASYLDTSDEWIKQRTGIKSRVKSDVDVYEMARSAVLKLPADDLVGVDLIVVTSMSNKNLAPTISAMLTDLVDRSDVFCIDLNAACSAYVYGLITIDNFLKSSDYTKALLVTVEKMSDILDYNDRSTCILFGDCATASVITSSEITQIVAKHVVSKANDQALKCFNDSYLEMKGQDVFKFAIRAVCESIDSLLASSGLVITDINNFYFHQANMRILSTIIKKYNLDESKVYSNLEKYANTSSSSIPLLLSEYPVMDNEYSIMVGFGAGLTYGAILYKS